MRLTHRCIFTFCISCIDLAFRDLAEIFSPSSFFVDSLGFFYVGNFIGCKQSATLPGLSPFLFPLLRGSGDIPDIPATVNKSRRSHLFPALRGTQSAGGRLVAAGSQTEQGPPTPSLPRVFRRDGRRVLSTAASMSIVILWFSVTSLLLWWITFDWFFSMLIQACISHINPTAHKTCRFMSFKLHRMSFANISLRIFIFLCLYSWKISVCSFSLFFIVHSL